MRSYLSSLYTKGIALITAIEGALIKVLKCPHLGVK